MGCKWLLGREIIRNILPRCTWEDMLLIRGKIILKENIYLSEMCKKADKIRSLAEFQLIESKWLKSSLCCSEGRRWLPAPHTWQTLCDPVQADAMLCFSKHSINSSTEHSFFGSGGTFYILKSATVFDNRKERNKTVKLKMTVFIQIVKCARNFCHFCFCVLLCSGFSWFPSVFMLFSSSEQMLPDRDS